MNNMSQNMHKFLSRKDTHKGLRTELALALINMIGGEQAFVDTLKDTRSPVTAHRVEKLSHDSDLSDFYIKNMDNLLDFGLYSSIEGNYGSIVNYALTNIDKGRFKAEAIGEALYAPTASSRVTDNSVGFKSAQAATKAVALFLTRNAIACLSMAYQKYLNNGQVEEITHDFLNSLALDDTKKLDDMFAKKLIDHIGGEHVLHESYREIMLIGNEYDLITKVSKANLPEFFNENKADIISLLRKCSPNTAITLVHSSMHDDSYSVDDVAEVLFDTDINALHEATNAVQRAAVELCVLYLAQDYGSYIDNPIVAG